MKIACSVFLTVVIFAHSSRSIAAQESEYRFQVDMQYAELAAGDKVVVRGSGPTMGNWMGADLVLKKTGRYHQTTVVFPATDRGATVQFKYVILRENGLEQGESRVVRSFEVGDDSGPPVFFNDLQGPMLTASLVLDIEVDLSEASFNGERPEGLGVSGGPLGPGVPALQLVDTEINDVWTGTIEFDALMPADALLQFFFLVDGHWVEEPGGLKHALLISGEAPVFKLHFDPEQARLIAYGDELLADRDAELEEIVGEEEKKSLYALYAALEQLNAGNLSSANGFFARFEQLYGGELLLDVYPRRYGYRLFQEGEYASASTYLKNRERTGNSTLRKAHYAFDIGAGWLGMDEVIESVTAFEAVSASYPEEIANVADFGKSLAYIRVDTLRAMGRTILTGLLDSGKRNRRGVLSALAQADMLDNLYREAAQWYYALAEEGTIQEQIKAHISALENRYLAGDDILVEIEALLIREPHADPRMEQLRAAAQQRHRTAHLLYLKARVLAALDREIEANAI